MSGAIDELHEAIDRIATLDVDAATDDELHQLTISLQRGCHQLAVAAARCLRRWDVREVWATDQSRSAGARLARECNTSMTTARRELRRAKQLEDLPATASAVAAGDLSLDHVDLFSSARRAAPDAFTADEAMLVERCRALRFRQAAEVVAYWRHHTGCADPAPSRDLDRAHASTTFDGTVVIDAVLEPIGGAIVVAELDRLGEQLRLTDRRDGTTRTAAQRRAAALVEMATRSASTPKGAKRPRPLFTVLIGDDHVRQLCELAAGNILRPEQLGPYLDLADLEVVLFDGPRTVLSVSKRRSYVGAVRRAIQVRDRRCQHPAGCDEPVDRCDVDHIDPWPVSHRTDQHNGRLQCTTHNRHADKHDRPPAPPPPRAIDHLDEIRARLRWRYLHEDDAAPP
jgi:hypothetical protein